MARQTGPVKITGTVDDICFYEMQGGYYARMKSSLTGKRFWKDKVFAGSRKSCGLMAVASPLASRLYRTLPPEEKGRPVYQALTGKVKLLLQQGVSEAGVLAWFEATFFTVPPKKEPRKAAVRLQVKYRPMVYLPLALPPACVTPIQARWWRRNARIHPRRAGPFFVARQ